MAEWKNFIECVNAQKIPLITGEDGLKVLQIIEAARHSEKSGGKMVEVEKIQVKKAYL
jgi:predicted dehydrogenase